MLDHTHFTPYITYNISFDTKYEGTHIKRYYEGGQKIPQKIMMV
jgi:hypothetical protein